MRITLFPTHTSGVGLAVSVGIVGQQTSTVTSTVNGAPGHPLAVGVTVYLTTPDVVPVFVSVCAIDDPQAEEQLLNPVIVPPEGAVCIAVVQVYVVPVTVELNVTLLVVPPQIVCGEAEPTGVGLTVIVKVFGVPVQALPQLNVSNV